MLGNEVSKKCINVKICVVVVKLVVFEKLNSSAEFNKTSLAIMGMIKHFELLETASVHQVFFDLVN